MADYEWTNNVGTWFFHALIESSKLELMARNEEANHQNKPRASRQFEGTFEIDEDGVGSFVQIGLFEPEYTTLLFGVHVVDSDSWPAVYSENVYFPTGPGIGPFLRPPIMVVSPSAFAISDANGGRTWQTADVTAATDESSPNDWILVQIGKPYTAESFDNYKAGINLDLRPAGFDGNSPSTPAANTNYYVFWHAIGAVAAYD